MGDDLLDFPTPISSRAMRLMRTGWSCSPTIVTSPASRASVSSAGRTEPSIEFSNGISARSARPSRTASIASETVIVSTGSPPAPPAARSASSVNVPAGPR